MNEILKIKLMMHIVPSMISILMLVLCVEDWPYIYYKALRFVIFFSAIGVAIIAVSGANEAMMKEKKISFYMRCTFTVIFGLVALLFNPLWPVHLSRDIWVPIDLVTAGIFSIGLFVLRFPHDDMD